MELLQIADRFDINNRRDFLSKLFAVATAPVVLSSLGSGLAFAEEAPAASATKRKLRIGTCDWSLRTPLTTKSFHTAKEIGLEGLQYSFGLPDDGVDLRLKSNRDLIRQTVKETGVGIASLGMAILNKRPYAKEEASQQIVIDCIETMAAMKKEADELEDRELAGKVAPDIALVAFFGKADLNGHPDLIDKVIKKFKQVAPLAEKHGFTLGIESLLNEAEHRRIMNGVGSSAIKVYYDVANSHRMGYDIYSEMESLGSENICEIHCKEKNVLLGKGQIDFDRVRSIIEASGYDGWLIIEGAVPKKTEIAAAYKQNAEFLQSVFNSGRD